MPRIKSKDVRDHAKAGMDAFGRNSKGLRGPVNTRNLPKEPDADDGAAPGTYRPHAEPDEDDKKRKKVGAGKSGPSASTKIKAGPAKNVPPPFKKQKREKGK